MMRITLDNYLMGRDAMFPEDYATVKVPAEETVQKVNNLLAVLEAEGVKLEASPKTGSIVNSGWRPLTINSQVPGAAVRSKHITAQACDLYDPEGVIDDYLMSEAGQRVLLAARLYLEHPAATKGWSHVQTVSPASGKRVFFP